MKIRDYLALPPSERSAATFRGEPVLGIRVHDWGSGGIVHIRLASGEFPATGNTELDTPDAGGRD